MRQERAAAVGRRIADFVGHGVARCVQLGLGHHAGRVADDGVGRFPVDHGRGSGELVGVGLARDRVELVGDRPRRMIHAVAESEYREDHQCGDLDDVDCDVHRRRSVYAAVGDVSHGKGKHHGDQHHEGHAGVRRAHEIRPDSAHQVAAQDSHDADHDAGVDPVVQVRGPADDELGEAGILPGLVVIEERLLGEVIRAASAGVELRHLGVADGGRQTEQKGEHDAHPHGRGGDASGGLDVERQPQEGAGRDQRHSVHRQASQAQSCFHFDWSVFSHLHSP